MQQDAKEWHCGHCPLSVEIPPEYPTTPYIDALAWIREHRFAHLMSALESATNEELMGLCYEEPVAPTPAQGTEVLLESIRALQEQMRPTTPVESADVGPVLAGITELLKADLPRARKERGL